MRLLVIGSEGFMSRRRMPRPMRLLVIGSEGNIGKPLVKYLCNVGHKVTEADIRQGHRPSYYVADINHPIDLMPLFQSKPDVTILLSAMVSRVTCEQASSLAVCTNLYGLNNVIQLCKQFGSKLIYFSTSEVYGPKEFMSEDDVDLKPNNRYGLTKLLGERLVEYEVRYCGLNAVTIRPFMLYDENEDIGDHRSAMIRFAYGLHFSERIEVHKNCKRSWLHVSDAVRAIESAMHLDKYHVINIGSDEVTSIEELAYLVCDTLPASRDLIDIVEQPKQMTPIKIPNISKQKELLGVVPEVSIKEGVKRVCNVMCQRFFHRRDGLC